MAHAAATGGVSIGAVRRFSTVMLIICAALWIMALLMQAGVLHRQDRWLGPFPTEAPGSPVVVLRIGQSRPLPALTDTGGDDLGNPSRSNIAVTVAGERWEAGHTPHTELRTGKTRAFSHWGNELYLSLPAGAANGPELVITADYRLQPRPWVARTLLLAVALLGALRFRIAIVEGTTQGFVRRLMAIRRVACIAGVVVPGLALTAYAITILYGWIARYALPTVALFDVFPAMRRLALWEPNAPNALYALAGVGAILEWLICWGKWPSTDERSETIGTRRGGRLAVLFGAVFLTLLFAMSNGGWRGVMNAADHNYMSMAGLLPHSDASNYFTSVADLSLNGRWGPVASQRPIAEAIRTGIVAVGGTYVASLILQAALLAICAATAILGVAEILGVWSAMVFAGLLLGLERPYVTTTVTETLGLGAAVLSAPFLLRALRDQSYGSALAAFGLVTTALLIRMGSMFTLPLLAAWVIFLGVRKGNLRAALAGIGIVGAGLWFGQWALLRLYGDAQFGIGGNFSYTLCGLATGTGWSHCFSEAAREDISMQSITSIALEKAWQVFRADPTVMAAALIRNAVDYFADLPNLLFRQYNNAVSVPSEWTMLGVAAPILVVAARIRTPFYASAIVFFVLLYLTTVASAAVFYVDDGRRVMIVSNVLLSLGLALGFALPRAPRPASPAAPGRRGLYLVLIVVLLVFGLPALVKARVIYRMATPDATADTIRVAAAPRTPAVLVQPSESPPDRHHLSVSSELLRQIGDSINYDPDWTQTLDYASTNAPATLLVIPGGQVLLGGADLLKHRDSDLRVQYVPVNAILSKINRWWPDPGQGSPP